MPTRRRVPSHRLIQATELTGRCPNGHTSCLLARCWLGPPIPTPAPARACSACRLPLTGPALVAGGRFAAPAAEWRVYLHGLNNGYSGPTLEAAMLAAEFAAGMRVGEVPRVIVTP